MDNLLEDEMDVKLLKSKKGKPLAVSLTRPLRKTFWRWVALGLMNLLMLGNSIAIDSPQPVETQLQKVLNLSDQEYSMLYSVFAFPGIIVPFIGGYVTDKLGIRLALLLFSATITFGQFVYAYGGYVENYWYLLAGRAIFAIGSNPLSVAQVIMKNKWFKGREIGTALALGTSTLGIGKAINSFAMPKLYALAENLFVPLISSALLCSASLVSAVFILILDRVNDGREKKKRNVKNDKLSVKDTRGFRLIVWLIIFNFALTNGVFSSFNAFTNDLYHVQYDFSNSEAGNIISLNFIITTVTSAIFGKIVDKYGRRTSMIMFGSLLNICAYAYYIMVPQCSGCLSTIIPQIFFGLFIGINSSAIFPTLPLLLDEQFLGTGFGLFYVFQNVLVLVLPYIGAIVKQRAASDPDNGYNQMFLFFGLLALLTVVESVIIHVVDRLGKGILGKRAIFNRSEVKDIMKV